MFIQQFAREYCPEIVARAEQKATDSELFGFSCDDIIEAEDGTKIEVIYTPNFQIPIRDILTMDREDFKKVWPQEECLAAFDRYVSTLIILKGRDALYAVMNRMKEEKERLASLSQLPKEFL